METFIYEEYLTDLSVCDAIIAQYKSSDATPGMVGMDRVDRSIKESLECVAIDNEETRPYFVQLQNMVDNYIKKYHFSDNQAPWRITEVVKIQHYRPNEGYYAWHCERGIANHMNANRHMVFMTYLNDVTDGGGTEFYYQNKITEARKGKTLIWPADWTHTHRGVVSPTQDKYIITGWLNYV